MPSMASVVGRPCRSEDGDHGSKKSVVCDGDRLSRKMVHERIRKVSRGHFPMLHQQPLSLEIPLFRIHTVKKVEDRLQRRVRLAV